MGVYVNPRNESKEDFLFDNGIEVAGPQFPPPDGYSLVCWVDNGYFTAAGVVLSREDLRGWTDPNDTRPKQWFLVKTSLVKEVSG